MKTVHAHYHLATQSVYINFYLLLTFMLSYAYRQLKCAGRYQQNMYWLSWAFMASDELSDCLIHTCDNPR